MKLDTNSGSISFNSLNIGPRLTIDNVKALGIAYDLHTGVINGDHESYILRNIEDGDYGISCYFFQNKLKHISIGLGRNYDFPSYENSVEEIAEVKHHLQHIGGAKKYDWGHVELSIDPKGGNVNIIVIYNS